MRSVDAKGVSVASLLVVLLAACGPVQPAPTAVARCATGSAAFSEARRVVARYCSACHAPNGAASDYDWSDEHALRAHRRSIAAMVGAGSMPPAGQARPSAAERQQLLCWAGDR